MNTTASQFSSSETATLERQTEANGVVALTLPQVWNEALQKVCIGWIRQNGIKDVCLQFPDQYLPHSTAIHDSLKEALKAANGTNVNVYILGDTSYGSCCVDEIAAAHVKADSLIHFGMACRSKVSRLPVLYMFPQYSIDLPKFFEALPAIKESCENEELCVYLDIGYHHLVEQNPDNQEELNLNNEIKKILPCKELHIEIFPASSDAKAEYEPSENRICVFIGEDNSSFFNLSLTTKAAKWYIYDPNSNTLSAKNPLTANFIRRRYYYIEKCKDAEVLGLIVATLSSDGYLDIVKRLQELAKNRLMRTQIISVGRINTAKLANFLEIDCFVLIGCPFNTLYTSKEFYKPIVSVFEAEMALNPAWYMKYPEAYVTDFKELLPEGRSFLPANPQDFNELDVSLVSGRVRGGANNNETELADISALSEQQQSIIAQGKMEVMTTNTGLTFEDRTWKGLDPALGRNEPAKLQKGLKGIPIAYSHD